MYDCTSCHCSTKNIYAEFIFDILAKINPMSWFGFTKAVNHESIFVFLFLCVTISVIVCHLLIIYIQKCRIIISRFSCHIVVYVVPETQMT